MTIGIEDTIIVNVLVVVAHCPDVGVKVYVVVALVFNEGDHAPVIPLFEVLGKADKVPPEHIDGTAVKTGGSFGVTPIVIVAVVAH